MNRSSTFISAINKSSYNFCDIETVCNNLIVISNTTRVRLFVLLLCCCSSTFPVKVPDFHIRILNQALIMCHTGEVPMVQIPSLFSNVNGLSLSNLLGLTNSTVLPV